MRASLRLGIIQETTNTMIEEKLKEGELIKEVYSGTTYHFIVKGGKKIKHREDGPATCAFVLIGSVGWLVGCPLVDWLTSMLFYVVNNLIFQYIE
jgi:hypothetical protein